MTIRFGPPLIAGKTVFGTGGLGLLGAQIRADTATGAHGPGVLFNDLTPADDAKEIRALLLSTPQGVSSFFMHEDGSFDAAVSGPGTYSFSYRLFVDGVDVGTATTTFSVAQVASASAVALMQAALGVQLQATAAVSPAPATNVGTAQASFAAVGTLGVVMLATGQASLYASPAPAFALVPLADLLPYVHDDLPAVPHLVAIRALNDAVRLFCERSTVWREEIEDINVVTNQADYALVAPHGAAIVSLQAVFLAGRELAVTTADRATVLARRYAPAGRPALAYLMRQDALRLIPRPDTDQPAALSAAVAVQPGSGATSVPKFLADAYDRVLGAGAKYLLSLNKNSPWYDPAGATTYASIFFPAAAKARADISSAFGGATQMTEMRRWV